MNIAFFLLYYSALTICQLADYYIARNSGPFVICLSHTRDCILPCRKIFVASEFDLVKAVTSLSYTIAGSRLARAPHSLCFCIHKLHIFAMIKTAPWFAVLQHFYFICSRQYFSFVLVYGFRYSSSPTFIKILYKQTHGLCFYEYALVKKKTGR